MNVAYVDKEDNLLGSGSISDAVKNGTIVRLVRIFLFNSKGELLIQKRSDTHRALPGRWDHSASGHVDYGESYLEAANRELAEEMGISGISLQKITKFYLEEKVESLIKKSFNIIYSAMYDGKVSIDKNEVSDCRWISLSDLEKEIESSPNNFPEGFIKAYEIYKSKNKGST